jgi:TolA-binding protein
MRIPLALVCLCLCVGLATAQNSKENADFKLAINLYNDGLYDLAAEQLKQFIGSYPNSDQGVEARYYLGLTQIKLRQFEDARLTFQTFALTYTANPKAPDAWWKVGETFVAVRNYREAALAFERVKVFYPKSKNAAEALLTAGKYFSLAGEKDNARRVLRIILQEYGSSAAALPARTNLAQIYFEEGNLEQARGELKRVIEGDPSPDARAQALLILGNIHQATGKTDEARSTYQDIISNYKNAGAVQGAYLNLGKILASAGQHEAAIDNLKKALAQKSTVDSLLQQEALILLGDEYAQLHDYGNAVASYDRALTLHLSDDRSTGVLWKIARASARGKNYRKSNEACARILKTPGADPLKRQAQLRLALNSQEQKSYSQAVQQFISFAEQYPDDPSAEGALFRAATITEKDLQDPRKAAVLYEALAARSQHSPLADDALAGSARCYDQLKEFPRTMQQFHELIVRYPASEQRRAAEDRMRIITLFEAKDKDSGLEKLALLVGDVVAQKDRAGLALRLGEIYFQDLKNYEAAADQFTTALEAGLSGPRAADARLYRARSLEYLSIRDNAMRSAAVEAFQLFLTSTPRDSRAADAALSLFMLKSGTVAEAQAAAGDIQKAFPAFPRRDTLLLRIGTLQEGEDSLASAAETYGDVLRTSPSSPSAEEAGYRLCRLLTTTGLSDSAIQSGSAYLEDFPRSRYAALMLAQLGDATMARGDASRAIGFYQKLADDFFYTSQAADEEQSLADAYAANGNYTEAVNRYQMLLARREANPFEDQEADSKLLLALGRAEYLGGNYREAQQQLFRMLSRESTGPKAGEAYTTLGMISRSEGSLEAATTYFRLAANAAPGATTTPDVADLLYASGEYDEAIKQYTQLAKVARTEEERRQYEARIILSELKNDAMADAEKMIPAFAKKYQDTDSELASFELERGNYFFRKKDYARAMKSYQTVSKKYEETPSTPEALYWTGKALEASNKPKEAIEQLTQLTTDYPEAPILPRAYLALGNLHYAGEKWDEAIRSYRRIVDDPKADPALLPFAMSNLIATYETAGVYDAALALTRKYLELYPNADDALDKRIKIGILYDHLGYYDQAVLHLQTLLDEAGSDLEGEIRYYIAEANYHKGDYQQAILDFLKVPYLVTKKGKIDWTANSLYMSGQAYEKMGRYDQALGMYQQIIDRPGIDGMFKAAAKKEIDRVKLVLQGKSR